MTSYLDLLAIILPIFSLFAIGLGARRLGWMSTEAEPSYLKLVINLFYPCLVFRSVLDNPALRNPSLLLSAPALGFTSIVLGLLVGYLAGRALGMTVGTGLRTFSFSVGVYNYGYIPIALIDALWGRQTLGVLLVFNTGIELALWTVGILTLSGLSLKEGWRRLANPVVCSLVAGVALNMLGVTLPAVLLNVISLLAACAIPLGLMSAGAALEPYVRRPADLFEPRVSFGGPLLRYGLIPIGFLVCAKWLPVTGELRRVLIVQAAMPAGMFPLVLARHYGGQPLVAARNIIATTLVGIVLIPLWLHFGLSWAWH
ncbi:membrane transport protein [mine drainage metagenome]|uniref:Membrane transport protein n=1 Tax=mine drainage metagenome TaxID=410659 RepID=A0A1J5SYR7_9ZZZZ